MLGVFGCDHTERLRCRSRSAYRDIETSRGEKWQDVSWVERCESDMSHPWERYITPSCSSDTATGRASSLSHLLPARFSPAQDTTPPLASFVRDLSSVPLQVLLERSCGLLEGGALGHKAEGRVT